MTRTWATARGCGSPRRSWTAPACPATARKTRGCAGWRCTTATTTSTSWRPWPGRTAAGPAWTTNAGGSARRCATSRPSTACVVVARADRTAARRPDPGRDGEGGPGRAGRAAPGHAAPPRGRRRGRGPVRAGVLRRPGPARRAGPAAAQRARPGRGDRVRGHPGRGADRGRGAGLVRRREASAGPDPAEAAAPLARAGPPGPPAGRRPGQPRRPGPGCTAAG